MALVVDKHHSRFGQIGAIMEHDWREYGNYCVRFSDGKTESMPDGMCQGDSKSPVEVFYRKDAETGIKLGWEEWILANLKERFLELDIGQLEDLADKYQKVFGETLQTTT